MSSLDLALPHKQVHRPIACTIAIVYPDLFSTIPWNPVDIWHRYLADTFPVIDIALSSVHSELSIDIHI